MRAETDPSSLPTSPLPPIRLSVPPLDLFPPQPHPTLLPPSSTTLPLPYITSQLAMSSNEGPQKPSLDFWRRLCVQLDNYLLLPVPRPPFHLPALEEDPVPFEDLLADLDAGLEGIQNPSNLDTTDEDIPLLILHTLLRIQPYRLDANAHARRLAQQFVDEIKVIVAAGSLKESELQREIEWCSWRSYLESTMVPWDLAAWASEAGRASGEELEKKRREPDYDLQRDPLRLRPLRFHLFALATNTTYLSATTSSR